MPPATLHALEPADDARADARQRPGRHFHGYLQPLVGPLGRIVGDVSVDPATASSVGADEIPAGAARAEAVAVLLRRAGHEVEWGDPGPPVFAREIERFAYERGRSSVDIVRAGPTLVTELQIGAWFNAGVRRRLIRRLLVRSPRIASLARFAVPYPYLCDPGYHVRRAWGLGARRSAGSYLRMIRATRALQDADVPQPDDVEIRPGLREVPTLLTDEDSGLFLVDREGVIRWGEAGAYVGTSGAGPVIRPLPPEGEILRAVAALS